MLNFFKIKFVKLIQNCFSLYFTTDAAIPGQISFQTPANSSMEGIVNLHHDIFSVMIILVSIILYLTLQIIIKFSSRNKQTPRNFSFKSSSFLEIMWTSIPIIILLFIIYPSFTLLYSMDQMYESDITLKVIGRQWYWTYEISTYFELFDTTLHEEGFDSVLIPEADLPFGSFRLLEVDNRVLMPTFQHIKVLITASDVLHSWAIPSLGVKMDACPGRLNQLDLFIARDGIFFGQCSELCGIYHGFMPIVIQANPENDMGEAKLFKAVLFS